MTLTNKIIAILLIIIFILIGYIIFTKQTDIVKPFDDSKLKEEVRLKDSVATYWEKESANWESLASEYSNKADSLQQLKSDIHEKYKDQYNFNATATNIQLDSIIRANWN